MIFKVTSTFRTVFLLVICGSASALASNIAVAPNGGFWVQSNRGTSAVNGAPQFADVPYSGVIVAVPGHNGYWVVTSPSPGGVTVGGNNSDNGHLYARGDAPLICGPNDGDSLSKCTNFKDTGTGVHSVNGAAATPDGEGLWVVDDAGNVWTAGTAKYYGGVQGKGKAGNEPAEIRGTLSGNGYYIFMSDGGVYTFGDAVFFGSTGGKLPGGDPAITSAALSLDAAGQVNGYWMVAEDGGVFSFGDAFFLGSSGGKDKSVIGITALQYARGYAWANKNGNVSVSKTFPRVVIQSQRSGYAIDVLHGSTDSSALLVQTALSAGSTSSTSQQWDFYPTDGSATTVQMVNVNSRLCVDLSTEIIQFPCKSKPASGSSWDNQRWTMTTEAGSGGEINTLFQSVNTGGLLGISSTADGARLSLYPAANRVLADGLVNWGIIPVM
jgi:hypothetical protein